MACRPSTLHGAAGVAERKMWTKSAAVCRPCGDLPYRCTGRVLNPSPPNTSSAWFPSFARVPGKAAKKQPAAGKLPKDIQRRKTEHFTASANDAFAIIRYHRQGLHRGVLRRNPGLPAVPCFLLQEVIFPSVTRWSSVGRKNSHPPIPGSAQKGSQSELFACAVQYPSCASGYGAICGHFFSVVRSGTKTSRMKLRRCPAPLLCSPWGLRENDGAPLVTEYLPFCGTTEPPPCKDLSSRLDPEASGSNHGRWGYSRCGAHYGMQRPGPARLPQPHSPMRKVWMHGRKSRATSANMYLPEESGAAKGRWTICGA